MPSTSTLTFYEFKTSICAMRQNNFKNEVNAGMSSAGLRVLFAGADRRVMET